MRTVVATAGFTLAACSIAWANAALPVSQTYGSDITCGLFAKGGERAVMTAGTSEAIGVDDNAPDYLLVTPEKLLGAESQCTAGKVTGPKVVLDCAGEETTYRVSVTLSESSDQKSLTFTDENGTITLHRCKP